MVAVAAGLTPLMSKLIESESDTVAACASDAGSTGATAVSATRRAALAGLVSAIAREKKG
jgi:hypothetical protein